MNIIDKPTSKAVAEEFDVKSTRAKVFRPGFPFPPGMRLEIEVTTTGRTYRHEENGVRRPIPHSPEALGTYGFDLYLADWPFPLHGQGGKFVDFIILHDKQTGKTWWLDHVWDMPECEWVELTGAEVRNGDWVINQVRRTISSGGTERSFLRTELVDRDHGNKTYWLDHNPSNPNSRAPMYWKPL